MSELEKVLGQLDGIINQINEINQNLRDVLEPADKIKRAGEESK